MKVIATTVFALAFGLATAARRPENPSYAGLSDAGRRKLIALRDLEKLQENMANIIEVQSMVNDLVEVERQVSDLIDDIRVLEGDSFTAVEGDDIRYSVPA